jgi:hypothetical protein
MIITDLQPLKKLTPEIVDTIKMHSTISHLRRSIGTAYNVRIAGDKEVPTLFYVKNTNSNGWEVHALVTDICKFILKGSLYEDEPCCPCDPTKPSEPSEADYIKSLFYITTEGIKVTYNTHVHELTNNKSTCALIEGVIPFDQEYNCYIIKFMIIPDSTMIQLYGVPRVILENEGLDILQDYNSGLISGVIKVTNPSQNGYLTLNWDSIVDSSFNPEEFGIELINCTLATV